MNDAEFAAIVAGAVLVACLLALTSPTISALVWRLVIAGAVIVVAAAARDITNRKP